MLRFVAHSYAASLIVSVIFITHVKAFLLSTFAGLYDSFLISVPLFLCVFGSFHQFTSIKSVSLMSKTKTYFSHLAFDLDRV